MHSEAPIATRCWRRRRPTAAPTAATSCSRSRPPSRTPSVPTLRPSSSSPTTSASSVRSSTNSSPRGARSTWFRHRRRRPTVLAREPDGVFLSNGPGDPAPLDDSAGERARACSGKCRCSASASGTRSWALALGARTFKLRFGHHGGNHPVRHLATGRVEITSQNHNYAVDADTLPEGSVVTSCEPERRRRRRRAQRPRCARSACSTTRRPGPDPTMPATCSASSPSSWNVPPDAPPRRPRDDPAHRQWPDHHRAGLRVRLLRHPGVPRAARRGLPRRPRQLEPGDDHDRPRVRRRHVRRAARRLDARAHHREGTARRAAADARRSDRPQPRGRAARGRRARSEPASR